MKLSLNNITAGYNGTSILHDITTSMHTGEIICILGPNGSGKTTLFKTILGLLPSKGGITLDDRALATLHRRERARFLAYIPQIHIPPFPFTVLDVVLTGRTPFIGLFSSPSGTDRQCAMRALETLEAGHLASRDYARISGGERQLVLIARALAQSPRFLIMDEPTSHLDFGNQVRTIRIIRQLARNDRGVILTSHVPDHAFMCASRVVALLDGKILVDGVPKEVLTPSVLHRMYGVDVDIVPLSHGRCTCTPAPGGYSR
jgi:iron complex transport system ATP-binding protein